MEPVLSLDKDKVGPPPCTAGIEHTLLCSPDTMLLDNKKGDVKKAPVATGIIVIPAAAGNNPAAVISSIEPFNSRF